VPIVTELRDRDLVALGLLVEPVRRGL
jgi:hypothetical protein